jgi:hypothetical protein
MSLESHLRKKVILLSINVTPNIIISIFASQQSQLDYRLWLTALCNGRVGGAGSKLAGGTSGWETGILHSMMRPLT